MGTVNDKGRLQKARKVQVEPVVALGDAPKMLEPGRQSSRFITLGVKTLVETIWTTVVATVSKDGTNVADA